MSDSEDELPEWAKTTSPPVDNKARSRVIQISDSDEEDAKPGPSAQADVPATAVAAPVEDEKKKGGARSGGGGGDLAVQRCMHTCDLMHSPCRRQAPCHAQGQAARSRSCSRLARPRHATAGQLTGTTLPARPLPAANRHAAGEAGGRGVTEGFQAIATAGPEGRCGHHVARKGPQHKDSARAAPIGAPQRHRPRGGCGVSWSGHRHSAKGR
jgi:hypothetical protein